MLLRNHAKFDHMFIKVNELFGHIRNESGHTSIIEMEIIAFNALFCLSLSTFLSEIQVVK